MSKLDFLKSKIQSAEELKSTLLRWRLKGQKVVFTNGVFDILHKGHITLLASAAELGDKLVLGLNSDASVKTLGKGPDRPINGEYDRAYVLAALAAIDVVTIFSETTPYNLIRLVEPDILVKGGDYNPEETDKASKTYIVGSDLQRQHNRETVSIDLVEGYSTTATLKRAKNGKG